MQTYLELHSRYKSIPEFLGWHHDYWADWIKCSPLPIVYTEDHDLEFSLPLAFAKLVIGDKKFMIGFDMWDKYPLFAEDTHENKATAEIRERWSRCDIIFKANILDPKSRFRYSGMYGYLDKNTDPLREASEIPSQRENIFPMGMIVSEGKYFVNGKYKRFRALWRNSDVFSGIGRQTSAPIRSKMIELTSQHYSPPEFIPSYEEYLKRLGRTKVAIDYPSNARISFKVTEALAMGALLVGPPALNVFPKGFILDNHRLVCKPDLSDLIESIDRGINDSVLRKSITKRAITAFDEILAPRPLSKYWIDTALEYFS